MKIVVVTVVMNDPMGFKLTKDSVLPHLDLLESWVIIDSSEHKLEVKENNTTYIWEEPDGIFPAMQSSLRHIDADSYVLFLNSGDCLLIDGLMQLFRGNNDLSTDVFCFPIQNPQHKIEYFLPTWYYKIGIIPLSHQGLLVKCALIQFNKQYSTIADLDLFRQLVENYRLEWNFYKLPLVRIAPMNVASNQIVRQRVETVLYLIRNKFFIGLVIRCILKLAKIKFDRPVNVIT